MKVMSSPSLRSRRKHKAWGASPRKAAAEINEPVERAAAFTSIVEITLCRLLRRIDRDLVVDLGLAPQALCFRLLRRLRRLRKQFVNNPGLSNEREHDKTMS